jgi:protein-S-isoprenylcysteine O-methyltransferase Ste14
VLVKNLIVALARVLTAGLCLASLAIWTTALHDTLSAGPANTRNVIIALLVSIALSLCLVAVCVPSRWRHWWPVLAVAISIGALTFCAAMLAG